MTCGANNIGSNQSPVVRWERAVIFIEVDLLLVESISSRELFFVRPLLFFTMCLSLFAATAGLVANDGVASCLLLFPKSHMHQRMFLLPIS